MPRKLYNHLTVQFHVEKKFWDFSDFAISRSMIRLSYPVSDTAGQEPPLGGARRVWRLVVRPQVIMEDTTSDDYQPINLLYIYISQLNFTTRAPISPLLQEGQTCCRTTWRFLVPEIDPWSLRPKRGQDPASLASDGILVIFRFGLACNKCNLLHKCTFGSAHCKNTLFYKYTKVF